MQLALHQPMSVRCCDYRPAKHICRIAHHIHCSVSWLKSQIHTFPKLSKSQLFIMHYVASEHSSKRVNLAT